MKYAIVIPDGCADFPVEELGGRTPMQAAHTPNLDALAQMGVVGQSKNVPDSMTPGSDVATLGLLGYDPAAYYTGRAPLEAAAQGIPMQDDDWAVRCNLVTIQDGVMKSFTAGHVSSEEAAQLIELLNQTLVHDSSLGVAFFSGVGYRNLAVTLEKPPFTNETQTFPPHDFTDKSIQNAMPIGPGAEILRQWIEQSAILFEKHSVNISRIERGLEPVTHVWPWGIGRKPMLPPFANQAAPILQGQILRGAMITAVDLLRGIAQLIGWENIAVPGITGYVDTDYAAKGQYAAEVLKEYDIVCVHVEATDEAGHEGNAQKKMYAMEQIDAKVIPPIVDALKKFDQWRIFVSPDHPTPVQLKTHTGDPVPWIMAGTGMKEKNASAKNYDEETAKQSPFQFQNGVDAFKFFLECQ